MLFSILALIYPDEDGNADTAEEQQPHWVEFDEVPEGRYIAETKVVTEDGVIVLWSDEPDADELAFLVGCVSYTIR